MKNNQRRDWLDAIGDNPKQMDAPTTMELDYLEATLNQLADISTMKVSKTDCIYSFDKTQKIFEVKNLPCIPSSDFELWAFRITLCLEKLGYKATEIEMKLK